jgi:4-hydroxy-tetrahydrodipicolinate reductase
MKIALIGYGKMGQAIEEIALERGHEIVLKVSLENPDDFTIPNLQKADVAIEFTGPDSAVENIKKCFDSKVPVVSGSTGWMDNWKEVETLCKATSSTLLYASNFSVGVNIFFQLNSFLAKLMTERKEYDVQLEEIHHTQKIDSPSGTAITIAEQILQHIKTKDRWVNEVSDDASQLEIVSKRIDPAPGTHKVLYQSDIDDIEIIHTAHSRKGFATGAVLAAEFIAGKTGIFSMNDVLGL